MQAMESFFWSTIIVLDGDFLKLPKFISMVNGGTVEHNKNGWHGLYVFSEHYSHDRIYSIDLDFKNFKDHAIEAAKYWFTQRQWFNESWRATDLDFHPQELPMVAEGNESYNERSKWNQ